MEAQWKYFMWWFLRGYQHILRVLGKPHQDLCIPLFPAAARQDESKETVAMFWVLLICSSNCSRVLLCTGSLKLLISPSLKAHFINAQPSCAEQSHRAQMELPLNPFFYSLYSVCWVSKNGSKDNPSPYRYKFPLILPHIVTDIFVTLLITLLKLWQLKIIMSADLIEIMLKAILSFLIVATMI